MINRNTPTPITPHNLMERRVEGLRDYSPQPLTYKLFRQMSNGQVVFVGEFPTPEVKYGLRKRGK